MNEAAVSVARVRMPEKGVFAVRVPSAGELPAKGCAILVNLDYGLDVGELCGVDVYDPERDGPHPPGFTFVRGLTEADDAARRENEPRALEMRRAFTEAARRICPDIRVPYARLSFGRSRLFIRYASERPRTDLSAAVTEIRRLFNVSVNAWQAGPRDEVRVMGAIGPCGRPCCCCSWQQKYPQRPACDPARGGSTAALNGVCGHYRCCLAFEEGGKSDD